METDIRNSFHTRHVQAGEINLRSRSSTFSYIGLTWHVSYCYDSEQMEITSNQPALSKQWTAADYRHAVMFPFFKKLYSIQITKYNCSSIVLSRQLWYFPLHYIYLVYFSSWLLCRIAINASVQRGTSMCFILCHCVSCHAEQEGHWMCCVLNISPIAPISLQNTWTCHRNPFFFHSIHITYNILPLWGNWFIIF